MGYRRHGFALQRRDGREQCARADKEHSSEPARAQLVNYMRADHRRAASAARTAGVHILLVEPIEHKSAVLVAGRDIDMLLLQHELAQKR